MKSKPRTPVRVLFVILSAFAGGGCAQPTSDALEKQILSSTYHELLDHGKRWKDNALPALRSASKATGISAQTQKAIRMIQARLGEVEAQRSTLQGLCSPNFDVRLETFTELKYIGGAFALSSIRTLLEYPSLLPLQKPEGDMHDSPFAYHALRLLSALRPDSPAVTVHWVIASSPRGLAESIRPSLAWLSEESRSVPLPRGMVPACLRGE